MVIDFMKMILFWVVVRFCLPFLEHCFHENLQIKCDGSLVEANVFLRQGETSELCQLMSEVHSLLLYLYPVH